MKPLVTNSENLNTITIIKGTAYECVVGIIDNTAQPVWRKMRGWAAANAESRFKQGFATSNGRKFNNIKANKETKSCKKKQMI